MTSNSDRQVTFHELQSAVQKGELRLSGSRLTVLPPEIGQLTGLVRLDPSSNQLTALPPEIGQLTSLMYLDLSSNQLTALPPEIGQLRSSSS